MKTYTLFYPLLFLFTSLLSAATNPPKISYVTDLEGLFEKWDRFLKSNPNFEVGTDGKFHLKSDAYFVFGGDATGRGPGEMRIVDDLLRLKQESGNRVVLLSGNREFWHTELPRSLSEAEIKKPKFHDGKKAPKRNRLYATRAEELGLLSGRNAIEVSDAEAKASLLSDFSPQGRYTNFLTQSELIQRIGNTLFVHAGINDAAYGYVPDVPNRIDNLDSWIRSLNAWYRSATKKYQNTGDPSELLSLDPVGDPSDSPSVAHLRVVRENNNPVLFSDAVMAKLAKAGIHYVFLGHTPMDQFPVTVRWKDQIHIISMDNSFAKNEMDAHKVTIQDGKVQLEVAFHHENGKTLVPFVIDHKDPGPIGKRLPDGSTLIAPLGDNFLSFQMLEKFEPSYSLITKEALKSLPLEDPTAPPPLPVLAEDCEQNLVKINQKILNQ